MKKMTSVMRNQLCVCIAMLILCVFACGCSEVQRLDTKQDNTSTNADVYVIDETQVSAEVQATTNDSTTEVSALGLTEVSSMKEAFRRIMNTPPGGCGFFAEMLRSGVNLCLKIMI